MTTYYGFKCPKCSSTVNIGVGEPNCPNCGTRMIPDKAANPVATNVHCSTCNISFGMINSDKCPQCGKPFS